MGAPTIAGGWSVPRAARTVGATSISCTNGTRPVLAERSIDGSTPAPRVTRARCIPGGLPCRSETPTTISRVSGSMATACATDPISWSTRSSASGSCPSERTAGPPTRISGHGAHDRTHCCGVRAPAPARITSSAPSNAYRVSSPCATVQRTCSPNSPG
ncbi:MAG: hypothetical protein M3419_08185, partial [Actinomycetota bacterium]|nr:hypothetical protein [Actinomycetota bacterium]